MPAAVAAIVLGVGAGGAFAYSRLAEPPPDPGPVAPAAADTVAVERTDLVVAVGIDGTLGFGVETPLSGRKAGTLTKLPAVGAVVGRGEALYEVDARPVPLLIGDTPLYRALEPGVEPGPDVAALVENLRELGYRDPGKGAEFGPDTQAALTRWQRDTGLPDTGTLDVGDVVVLPGPVRVATVTAQLGAEAEGDLLTHTPTTRSVTAALDPTRVDLAAVAEGAAVTLTMPDGSEVAGEVTALTTAPAEDGGERAHTASIAFDQSAARGVDTGVVRVEVVTERRDDVLTVPVSALLALEEGGFALQVVSEAGPPELVAVETGVFADGLVEVTGDGVTEGALVVRAS